MTSVSQARDYIDFDATDGAPLDASASTGRQVDAPTADGTATFVVDLARAEVVAGNAAARLLFLGESAADSYRPVTRPDDGRLDDGRRETAGYTLSIDRSTPALATLAGIGMAGERSVRLVFWTRDGVTAVTADCSRIASPLGDALVRIVVHGDGRRARGAADAGEGTSPVRRARPDGHAEAAAAGLAPLELADLPASLASPPPPAPPLDDAGTLAEIARRIRAALPPAAGDRAPDPPHMPARVGAADRGSPHIEMPQPVASEVTHPGAAPPPHSPPIPHAPTLSTTADTWTDLKLAKLAHELRTPLSAVVALAEIMRDERLGPMANARYRGYAADIYESTHHALGLIQSVVDEARGDSVPAKPLTAFDANRVLTSSISALDPFADRAGVTLVAALAPRLPVPAMEPRRLTQVLFNLLTNAFNHTPRGGRITVSAEARDGDGWLSLGIEDTGRGMAASAITRALAQEVSSARPGASPSGSTGFGLPIVRDIVMAAGGTIDIASEPGRGTRVAIALPPLRP